MNTNVVLWLGLCALICAAALATIREAEALPGPPQTWTGAPTGIPALNTIDQAVLLPTGKVLLRHNQDSLTTPETYVYDPATGTNSIVPGSVYSLTGSPLTLLANGDALITGLDGNVPSLGTGVYRYETAANVFHQLSPMSMPRWYPTAALMADGRVLVAGGLGTGLVPQSSSEIFEPLTQTWSAAASMAAARSNAASVLLNNGKVLVAGGRTALLPVSMFVTAAELYDPATDMWSPAGSVPAHITPALTVLLDGRVLMAGGVDTTTAMPLSVAVIYDPVTNAWAPAASMSHAHDGQDQVLLADGRVMVTGRGFDQFIDIYDPSTNTWSTADELIQAAVGLTLTRLPGGEVLMTPSNTSGPGIMQLYGSDGDHDGYNDLRENQLGEDPATYCKIMRAEVTGDNNITSGDLGKVASVFGPSPPPREDQNGDHYVTSADLGLVAAQFGKNVAACA